MIVSQAPRGVSAFRIPAENWLVVQIIFLQEPDSNSNTVTMYCSGEITVLFVQHVKARISCVELLHRIYCVHEHERTLVLLVARNGQ